MSRQLPVLPVSPLPPLYGAWIEQLLAGPIPCETDATCDDCAMLPEDGQAQLSPGLFFNPATKCCSYIPKLPNYLVGSILTDYDPAAAKGRATVEARLRAGITVTPLGLDAPPAFQLLYGSSAETLFGQSTTVLCPHYLADEGGRCGVWKHRTSVCATWHCKYVRGEVGYEFWSTLHQLLSEIEHTLSRWCVLELDIGAEALKYLFPPSATSGKAVGINPRALDGVADPRESKMLWGNWAGRELEFYGECARLVKVIDWQTITTIGGPGIRLFARLLSENYAKLISNALPERLRTGSITVIGMDKNSCQVSSYYRNDPLILPRQLLDVLHYFDGRPVNAALEAILDDENISLDPSLVRKLTDFGVLVPVEVEQKPLTTPSLST